MLELFIEMTNQVFWEGYAEQLSAENPTVFQFRFGQFADSYNQEQAYQNRTTSYFNKIIHNNYRDFKKQLQVK